MKLYLYSLKNRLSGLFERPVAEIYDEKEYPEYLAQSLALADVDVLARYKEYDVYCLGTLDNKSGVIVSSCDFISSLEPLCVSYIASKEIKDVGKEDVGTTA